MYDRRTTGELARRVSRPGQVPSGAGSPRIRSPVGGIFDSRPDALVGHRLVIEARYDVQVGVEPALVVPAERVAVGSEPPVQFGLYEKQQFPGRGPLLGGQVERRSAVNLRHDAAGAWNHPGRITRVSGRGVDAPVVLEVQVRLAEPVVIAEDTAFGHRPVLPARGKFDSGITTR